MPALPRGGGAGFVKKPSKTVDGSRRAPIMRRSLADLHRFGGSSKHLTAPHIALTVQLFGVQLQVPLGHPTQHCSLKMYR